MDIDDVVNRLVKLYEGVPAGTLREDFTDFCNNLCEDGFVVMGQSVEELDKKDEVFTYQTEAPFTMRDDFTQKANPGVGENTQDFFLEEVQGSPLISHLQFELSSRCNERCIRNTNERAV